MFCIYRKFMNYLNNDLSFSPSFHKNCMEPDGNAVFWLEIQSVAKFIHVDANKHVY